MILDQCPHCGTKHVQMNKQAAVSVGGGSQWFILRCQNHDCKDVVLVEYEGGSSQRLHPAGVYEFDPDADVSDEIREEFEEAGKCLDAKCAKASMVMSRRVLQRCLEDQGCQEDRLVDAIDWGGDEGVIRPALEPAATEVRQYGNLSAHPDDDQLENANLDSAEQILEFVRLLIHDFYEVPVAAAQLRRDREEAADSG